MKFSKPELKKFKKPEYWFPLISILFISFCLYLLYLDFTGQAGAGRTRIVGKIYYKNNVAQRKYSAQVVWNELQQGVDVYNFDTIRTDENSEATIELEDGTHIEMDQNSMIVLSLSENTAKIKFRGGSVRAHKTDEEKSEVAVSIDAGDKTITADKNGDIKLSGKDEESVTVTLKKGEAEIEAGGEVNKLKKDEQADITSKEIIVKSVNLNLLKPANRGKIFSKEDIDLLNFEWEPVRGENISIDVSDDPDFSRIRHHTVSRNGKAAFKMSAGMYYWRIHARGGKDISEVRTFSFVKNQSLNLYSPMNGEKFEYAENYPLIPFSWSKNNFASSYYLEISSDSQFKKIISGEQIIATQFSRQLQEGIYYWRVKSRGGPEESSSESAVQRFSVHKKKEKYIPELVSPKNDENIDSIAISELGQSFRWIENREIKKYRIVVSDNINFNNPIIEKTTNLNFYKIKQSIKAGRYYWKIQGIDEKNKPGEYSGTLSFIIKEPAGMELKSPADNEQFGTHLFNRKGADLVWKSYSNNVNYQILISRDKDMQKPVISAVVKQEKYHLSELDSGKYYWQIKLLNNNKKSILESEIRSFTLYESISDPALIFPVRGTAVDISEIKAIIFRYKDVPDAEVYEISIYEAATKRKIFNGESKDSTFSFKKLELLNTGTYTWSVIAKKNINNKEYRSNEIKSYFRITLEVIPPPEIKF